MGASSRGIAALAGDAGNTRAGTNGQLAPNDSAYSGFHYGATNTSAAGGGIYQDVSGLIISAGDTFVDPRKFAIS